MKPTDLIEYKISSANCFSVPQVSVPISILADSLWVTEGPVVSLGEKTNIGRAEHRVGLTIPILGRG